MNLTTNITSTVFHPSGEILAIASVEVSCRELDWEYPMLSSFLSFLLSYLLSYFHCCLEYDLEF